MSSPTRPRGLSAQVSPLSRAGSARVTPSTLMEQEAVLTVSVTVRWAPRTVTAPVSVEAALSSSLSSWAVRSPEATQPVRCRLVRV